MTTTKEDRQKAVDVLGSMPSVIAHRDHKKMCEWIEDGNADAAYVYNVESDVADVFAELRERIEHLEQYQDEYAACPQHGEHGLEAEQLQRGIRKLIANADRVLVMDDEEFTEAVRAEDLQELIDDKVNCADSLGLFERLKKEAMQTYKGELREELKKERAGRVEAEAQVARLQESFRDLGTELLVIHNSGDVGQNLQETLAKHGIG